MWPSVSKDLRHIVIVMVGVHAVVQPAIWIRLWLDAKCRVDNPWPMSHIASAICDDVVGDAKVGTFEKSTLAPVPRSPISSLRVLPFREELLVRGFERLDRIFAEIPRNSFYVLR